MMPPYTGLSGISRGREHHVLLTLAIHPLFPSQAMMKSKSFRAVLDPRIKDWDITAKG